PARATNLCYCLHCSFFFKKNNTVLLASLHLASVCVLSPLLLFVFTKKIQERLLAHPTICMLPCPCNKLCVSICIATFFFRKAHIGRGPHLPRLTTRAARAGCGRTGQTETPPAAKCRRTQASPTCQRARAT